ncbi:MAG: hypothetical protein ACTSV5_00360 [Promethearchaeota archaeon]
MEESEFLAISSLFDTIGVIEKGIERIYHYLLKHKRIDNLKEVSSNFGLTLKRGYKVCSMLNELELVQIYDRPMKIHLATPVLPLWQKIVNNRIEELSHQFQEKKERAESALKEFLKSYNIREDSTQEFVEFVNYDLNNFAETYSAFLAEKSCQIAIGIRYDNDLISLIKQTGIEIISTDISSSFRDGMLKIKENLKSLDMRVIFNAEIVKDLLSSKEFEILSKHVENYDIVFKNIDIYVTPDNFSNFMLTDRELIQPSFDPSNKLIGSYLSRNSTIYKIFADKFNELFQNGIPINQFLQEQDDLQINELNQAQHLVLCIL